MRIAFKHADPSRRTPTYLQANTQENVIWQLKLLGLLFVWIGVQGWWENRQYKKKYAHLKSHN